MAKRNITDLLGEELTESESTELSSSTSTPPPILTAPNAELAVENEQISKGSDIQSTVVTEFVATKVPKYLSLERKEVRLPSEHIDELTRLVRRLNRQKTGRDERITENTLIRIAVSLLVDFGESITGNNERELLESLRGSIGKE
ncbi:MAG: hypothetical protein MH252_07235 [Thermosynechococcaceae cyanobacterium MS004]|nr:hypothetical protein [Thermosynechococcaceae cyanobacterium MS004]